MIHCTFAIQEEINCINQIITIWIRVANNRPNYFFQLDPLEIQNRLVKLSLNMLPKLFLSQLEFTTKFETCKEAMSKLTFSKVGFNATGILKHQASSKIDVALELVELIQM